MSQYTGIDEIGRKEGRLAFYRRKIDAQQRLPSGGDTGIKPVP
jgi:hypothetical protein